MENNIEKRVSRLEGVTGRLAGMTQQVMDGQKTLAEVVIELSKEITGDFREEIKEEIVASGIKSSQYVDGRIGEVNETIVKIQEDIANDELSGEQLDELEKERRRRVIHLLVSLRNDKYKVFGSTYFKELGTDILCQFKISESSLKSFKRIKKNQFEEVLSYVRSWNPNENKIKAIVIADILDIKDKNTMLCNEIKNGKKGNRALVLGWFNGVSRFSEIMQLGEGNGMYPKINQSRKILFPFLNYDPQDEKTRSISYLYIKSEKEESISIPGYDKESVTCLFIGKETDKFHFALYY